VILGTKISRLSRAGGAEQFSHLLHGYGCDCWQGRTRDPFSCSFHPTAFKRSLQPITRDFTISAVSDISFDSYPGCIVVKLVDCHSASRLRCLYIAFRVAAVLAVAEGRCSLLFEGKVSMLCAVLASLATCAAQSCASISADALRWDSGGFSIASNVVFACTTIEHGGAVHGRTDADFPIFNECSFIFCNATHEGWAVTSYISPTMV
jgi:hypothetical protein